MLKTDNLIDYVRPSSNERPKTRNEKHETKRFSTSAVYHLLTPKQETMFRETVFDSRNMFSSEHERNKDQYLCFPLSTKGVAD